MIACTCVMCGATFAVYPAEIRKGGGICCGIVCRNRRLAIGQRRPLAERFWAKVEKTETCWSWTGAETKDGYGQLRRGGRANRCSWELHFGPIPAGMRILHTCDNPSCVRPDHLFLGTDADNGADCRAKMRHAYGERSGTAKLTETIVISIRAEYAAGGTSRRKLAEKYHISSGAIQSITNCKTWRHLLPTL